MAFTAGGADAWKLTVYGFAEADRMRDTTRSFNDTLQNNVVAHPQTQAVANPRLQGSIRNSRFGFRAEAPAVAGVRTAGVGRSTAATAGSAALWACAVADLGGVMNVPHFANWRSLGGAHPTVL